MKAKATADRGFPQSALLNERLPPARASGRADHDRKMTAKRIRAEELSHGGAWRGRAKRERRRGHRRTSRASYPL